MIVFVLEMIFEVAGLLSESWFWTKLRRNLKE